MRGYACSHCGAKPKPEVKIQPPGFSRTHCNECGKPLTVRMSDTETTVTARIVQKPSKRGKAYG